MTSDHPTRLLALAGAVVLALASCGPPPGSAAILTPEDGRGAPGERLRMPAGPATGPRSNSTW